jgi:hypothetical protein
VDLSQLLKGDSFTFLYIISNNKLRIKTYILMSHSCRGRVIAYGYLIRKGACREHLDYIYKGLISHH